MAHNLRNFRLDDEDWKAFVETCKTEKTSASAELAAFVKAYLGGLRLDKGEVNTSLSDRLSNLDAEIEAALQRILPRYVPSLEGFNEKVDALTKIVEEQSDRLGKSKPKPKGFG